MLFQADLHKSFWAEACNHACYLVNRSPSTTIDLKTPFEVFFGTPANYSDLKIFGCPAYAHVNDGKLEPRALKCIFLGYPSGVKGYRLWCVEPKSPKFLISRDVKFDEFSMLQKKNESIVANKDHGVSEQVELESGAPNQVQEGTSDQPSVDEIDDSGHDVAEEQYKQAYSIAKGKGIKEI